ncbi:hypothetical protein [Bosea sp. MMO-172]|uniref:hypothetical protein n=1 Tax=Bosea sp. MMO-172 TaxID=3127885 RepID=UPI0030167417
MFKSRTVFVVGAGASTEFGLPMGTQLTSKIASGLNILFRDGYTQTNGSKEILQALQNRIDGGGSDLNKLLLAGRKISANMESAISIDNYLNNRSDDEDIVFMGKLGIAYEILASEGSSSIAIADGGEIDLRKSSKSWINVFCKMLHENVPRNKVDTIFDNVSIICFNYDRCIEHYLLHALQRYFDLQEDHSRAIVNRLRIIHPYGRIGKLPWMAGPAFNVSYGASTNPQRTNLLNLAAGIRTFTERFEDDHETVKEVRQQIAEAEVLVFLGFSYGSMNMDLMSVPNSASRVVYGTAFGISVPNIQSIKGEIARMLGRNPRQINIELSINSKCYEFLNEYWFPIMRYRDARALRGSR